MIKIELAKHDEEHMYYKFPFGMAQMIHCKAQLEILYSVICRHSAVFVQNTATLL